MTGNAHAPRRRDDRGSAMILTLMVMALVTALASTVAVVTINNLQASWQARQAGSAVNSADGGVAQALAYLRNNGVRGLSCSPTCASNPWGNEANPASVTVAGAAGQTYEVWIEAVAAWPGSDPGLYRIHSTGSAAGAASRKVTAEVGVSPISVPTGIFARTINGGGAASVARESIISTGCVYNRSNIEMVEGEIDAAYGIPIGVHSSQIITDSNGSGQYCNDTNKPIHRTGNGNNQEDLPCNEQFPFDQDMLGGPLVASDDCHDARMEASGEWGDYYSIYDFDGDGTPDPGSKIESDADLYRMFNIRNPVLTQGQIDQLRTLAMSQDNFHTSATGWTSPDEANAVMFFELTGSEAGEIVDLNDIVGFGRPDDLLATDPACTDRSLIIVIEGGNARLNSNQELAASLFLTSSAPNGQVFKANGNANFVGTIYADTVNLVGTVDLSLDECFMANTGPALLEFNVANYREDDRGLD